MSVFEASGTLSRELIDAVTTAGASEQSLASSEANREGWQRLIDDYLIEWGRDPSQLADEDLIPPSKDLIRFASGIAMKWRDADCAAPFCVVPDGEGGITFERRSGDVFESLEILADGSIELNTFKNCRLLNTLRIPVTM